MSSGDASRQRLLRAAIELFTTRGYHLTTTPLIARRARLAEGTLYRHFPGKQDLLNELYRGAVRWAIAQADAPPGDGVPARARLGRVARALVGCAARDPAVIRMAMLIRHGDLLDERSRAVEREWRQALERVVAQGKSDGSVRVGGAGLWADVWVSVVRHALDRVSAGEWAEGHPAVEHVIDAAWRAIAATPGRAEPPHVD
jgi:AcrR family transcriptional regulator